MGYILVPLGNDVSPLLKQQPRDLRVPSGGSRLQRVAVVDPLGVGLGPLLEQHLDYHPEHVRLFWKAADRRGSTRVKIQLWREECKSYIHHRLSIRGSNLGSSIPLGRHLSALVNLSTI